MTRVHIESELKIAQMLPALVAASMTTPSQDIIDLQKQLQSLISEVRSKQSSLSKMYKAKPRPSNVRQRALQDQIEQEPPAGYNSQTYDTSSLTDQIRKIKILIPWIKVNQDHYNSVFFLLKNYILKYKVGFIPAIKKMHLGDTCDQIAQKIWSNLDSTTLAQMSTWDAFHRGWFIMSKMAPLMPQIDFLVSKIKSVKPVQPKASINTDLAKIYNKLKQNDNVLLAALKHPATTSLITAYDIKWGKAIQTAYNKSRNVHDFIKAVRHEVGFNLAPGKTYIWFDRLLKRIQLPINKTFVPKAEIELQAIINNVKGLWSANNAEVEHAVINLSKFSKAAKATGAVTMLTAGVVSCLAISVEIAEKIHSGTYETDTGDKFALDVAELAGAFLTIPQIGAQLGGIPFVVGSILWTGVSAMKWSIANDVTPDQKQIAIYEYFKDKMHDSAGVNTISPKSSQYSSQIHEAFLEILSLMTDSNKEWPRDFNFSDTHQSWLEPWQKEFATKYPWFLDSTSAFTVKLKDVMNNYYKYFYQYGNLSIYHPLWDLSNKSDWDIYAAEEILDSYKNANDAFDKKIYNYIIKMSGSTSAAPAYFYGVVSLMQCGRKLNNYQKKQECIKGIIKEVSKYNQQAAVRLNGIASKIADIATYFNTAGVIRKS